MARYPLNLPIELKREAETWAERQGVSLNQFILWAVSEKVGALKQQLDDTDFPQITYRRGAAGRPTAVLRETGIRVQTIMTAAREWQWTPEKIAEEYGLALPQVKEALAFYEAHRQEIDAEVEVEAILAGATDG
ncbi:MAG: DUF433 domain-containing protein [bacterium]